MSEIAELRALVRFHWRGSGRVILRRCFLFIVFPIAAIGLSQSPGYLLGMVMQNLGGGDRPMAVGFLGLLLLLQAPWAGNRITAEISGWMGQLPASDRTRRRAALLTLCLTQTPLVGLWAVLTAGGISAFQNLDPPRLLGFLLLIPSTLSLALPSPVRLLPTAGAVLATVAALQCTWPGVLLAFGLLILLDRLAPVRTLRRRKPRRIWGRATGAIPWWIAWRATRPVVPSALLVAVIPYGIGFLLDLNNPLNAQVRGIVLRGAALLAATPILLQIAERLAVHRPPWPWARSLPESSATKVLRDAAFFGVFGVLVILPAALLSPLACAQAALVLPWLCVRLASQLRQISPEATRIPPRQRIECFQTALLSSLSPWIGLALFLATPLALRQAIGHERRWKSGTWQERHYEASGDPGTWQS